jgi:N-acetylglutamate synthase-like GNAT family acetyltransferase
MNYLTSENPPLARCLGFLRDVHRRSATEIVHKSFGVGFFNEHFPDKQDLNVFWIDRIDPDLDAHEVIREIDRIQGNRGLQYRRLAVGDQCTLESVISALRDSTWVHSSNLLMTRDTPNPSDPSNEVFVQAVPLEQLKAHMHRWYLAEEGLTEDQAVMLVEASRETQQAVPTLYLAAFIDAKVVGWCELRTLEQTAQVENLGTLPLYRNRGVATALMNEALSLSEQERVEVIFVQTDAVARTQYLFSGLGFEPVGVLHKFLMPAA